MTGEMELSFSNSTVDADTTSLVEVIVIGTLVSVVIVS